MNYSLSSLCRRGRVLHSLVSRNISSSLFQSEVLKCSTTTSIKSHYNNLSQRYNHFSNKYNILPQQYHILSNKLLIINSVDVCDVRYNSSSNNLTRKEKLKRAVKEYGSTVIVFHVAISLASLGGFYILVDNGVDIANMMTSMGMPIEKFSANAGTFVVAYAVHKVFAPVRIFITLTVTPFLVRYLRYLGIIKRKI